MSLQCLPVLFRVGEVTEAFQQHVKVGEVLAGHHLLRHYFAKEAKKRDVRAGQDKAVCAQFYRHHKGVLPEVA